MQTDHRVPSTNGSLVPPQQHRKRAYSGVNPRKRDRHDLICVVCHASAMGYNFDQITCESCKAFFRRNALSNADKFKCRSGTDDCLITLETRKRCKACRLKKCFERGLRKEWIMSEEEKRTKKQKIEDNRRLRAVSQTMHPSSVRSSTPPSSPSIVPETEYHQHFIGYPTHFSHDDDDDDDSHAGTIDDASSENVFPTPTFDYRTLVDDHDARRLRTIENNYQQAVRLNVSVIEGREHSSVRHLQRLTDLVNELAQMSALRMITFFKLTPEFNSLHEDDRLALVKHNSVTLFYFHLSIGANLTTNMYRESSSSHDFHYHLHDLCRCSDAIFQRAMVLIAEIQQLCASDYLIVKLLMLVTIFTKGADVDEPVWVHTEQIVRAQNTYVELLWKYLDVRFGHEQTASIVSRLILVLVQVQALARQTKEAVRDAKLHLDQLAPLMQSICLIS